MIYENEHCEGCVWWANDGDACNHDDHLITQRNRLCPPSAYASDPACEDFEPDLECRQVRALERLAHYHDGEGYAK